MKLGEYLKSEGLTLAQFAQKIGRTGATVSRISRGIHRPDWDTVREIERVTKGKVTRNDFDVTKRAAPARRRAKVAA
jgi:transcriptional regulator with XRE-family HTH domain